MKFLSAAEADLDEIEEYIRSKDGALRAARIRGEIFHRIDLLTAMPGMGARRKAPDGRILRFTAVMRWWIIYEDREAENVVVIRRIVDSARQLKNLIF
ncbi:type II toxin-antitoxin system RelE/ParE family toxin [Oleomonas cavernae]|uniref:type II toxin-antitoxin system RelE/ParE family toxin n=1 Tax=Oleomonas cavernae TaxID=2320859 RepID=UPI0013147258|nr:type II toxin-antitoxin system RelE/ParE family toxin [Oleomonas cavernae]